MFRTTTQVFLALALPAAAAAQSTLTEHFGSQANGQTGYSSVGGVDFDQDGWDDLVVGTPFEDAGTLTDTGKVQAISGRDGSLLWTKYGLASDDYFGHDVALAGDVDGDGVQDVIAGAYNGRDPFSGLRTGFAKVYSGSTGALLHAVYGDATGDQLGWAVGGGLDHTGDGLSEFVAGAPNANWNGLGARGATRIYDGATGGVVGFHTSIHGGARWGSALFAQSDIDGDGTLDVVVGAPGGGNFDEGQVAVISGSTMLEIWNISGTVPGSALGASVTAGMDVNGDGRAEVIAGAPGDDTVAPRAGFVGMYSGWFGLSAASWFGSAADEEFGTSVAVLPDLDEDGRPDFVVGAPEALTGAGFARVLSSATGLEIFTVTGRKTGDLFGADVARAGDVNNDGEHDLLVGGRTVEDPGGTEVGSVRVFSAAGPGIASYCTSGASAIGCLARITAVGVPSASATSGFQLRANGVEGDKTGMFFYGANGRQAQTWGNGTSYQCVVPPVKRGGIESSGGTPGLCDGQFALDLNARWCPSCPKSAHNFGAGAVVQAQLWFRDPLNTSNQTTSLSDAVEFVVQP